MSPRELDIGNIGQCDVLSGKVTYKEVVALKNTGELKVKTVSLGHICRSSVLP